jgi:hypothetical protein
MIQKSPHIEEDCGSVDSGMRKKVPMMEDAEKPSEEDDSKDDETKKTAEALTRVRGKSSHDGER